jgi:intracellular septation protein
VLALPVALPREWPVGQAQSRRMKLLLDFLPLLLFFTSFKLADGHKDWAADFLTRHFGAVVSGGNVGATEAPVMLATLVVIAATLTQVGVMRLSRQKIHLMLWVSLVLVIVFGGLTIWFHNETFIKWKPSAVYWTLGTALWLTPLVTGKNLLKTILGDELQLPARIWHRLNFAWVAFFAAMGLVNLWVAYSFSTEVWASFKAFGSTALVIVFTLGQGIYLSRHIEEPPADGAGKADNP